MLSLNSLYYQQVSKESYCVMGDEQSLAYFSMETIAIDSLPKSNERHW